MNILVLGKGKTGSLVAEVARERGHQVSAVDEHGNAHGEAVAPEALAPFDVVIDFTTPEAALKNIEACARAGKKIVVGTTGWYAEMPRIRALIESSRSWLLWGGNFSVGVNLFYSVLRAASAAARYGYKFQITETHHVHKKDAPSGTAVVLRDLVQSEAGVTPEITSIREGEVMGRHTVSITSAHGVDTITLTHEAHSRRGFAEGAVRGGEWLAAQQHPGVYDFSEIFPQL